jgi:hypothetical protein
MVLKIYSLAYGFLYFVKSISVNLALCGPRAALKKNQTKPKVSKLLSNVCDFQKESKDFGKDIIP